MRANYRGQKVGRVRWTDTSNATSSRGIAVRVRAFAPDIGMIPMDPKLVIL